MSYALDKTVSKPVTKDVLVACFKQLGIKKGQLVEVHSSLSSFEYVVGGARTIVDALMEVIAEDGTILMPTHVYDNTEPSNWNNPAIEPYLYSSVRRAIPPYDPNENDALGMGAVVENFRRRQGVVTTAHPSVSYAAWGKYAKLLCNRQSLHFPLAEESPAARLYEMKGYVLLIGCEMNKTTCMHLAEYRTDNRPIIINGACIDSKNGPRWTSYLDLDTDSDIFMKVKPELQKKKAIQEIACSGSHIQFFSADVAIDAMIQYLERNSIYELYR